MTKMMSCFFVVFYLCSSTPSFGNDLEELCEDLGLSIKIEKDGFETSLMQCRDSDPELVLSEKLRKELSRDFTKPNRAEEVQ